MEDKLFEQRDYKDNSVVDKFSLMAIWTWSDVRKWAEKAEIGEKFGFSGRTYLIRVR